MYTSEIQLRVRYAETDQMAFAYYGNYAAWFEIGRVEALRALGIVYSELESQGVMLPVSEFSVKYIKPLKYDQNFVLQTTIEELPSVRIKFSYKCIVDGETYSEAQTTLFFMDKATGRPTRCPEKLSNLLRPYFLPDEPGV